MRHGLRMACVAMACLAGAVQAQQELPPIRLSLAQEDQSVYAPPIPVTEGQGTNQGAVHIDLEVTYLTDHIYRGVDHSEVGGKEDAPNIQYDGAISFDLGRLPHPFVGLFANIYNSDPISRFQEIRPYFGAELTIRPLILTAGHNTYIYPEREENNTSEVWAKITLDDSGIWQTDQPVFSPYVYAAYDYDLNNGVYVELGVQHDFIIEELDLTLTAVAKVAYIDGIEQMFIFTNAEDSGFQHYEVGLIASYRLNTLLNISRRYGEFSLRGYLFYTDGISDDIRADTQLWGGVGIGFEY